MKMRKSFTLNPSRLIKDKEWDAKTCRACAMGQYMLACCENKKDRHDFYSGKFTGKMNSALYNLVSTINDRPGKDKLKRLKEAFRKFGIRMNIAKS